MVSALLWDVPSSGELLSAWALLGSALLGHLFPRYPTGLVLLLNSIIQYGFVPLIFIDYKNSHKLFKALPAQIKSHQNVFVKGTSKCAFYAHLA